MSDLVERCLRELGGLDVVYANAGISGGRVPLLEQTVADWEEILRVNLIGPFLAIKHAAPLMMRRRAAARSSAPPRSPGSRAGAGGSPYSASKAA